MIDYLEPVIRFVSEFIQIDDAGLDEDTHLVSDLGLDSLDLSELALLIEEDFDVEIDDGDIEGWKTISDICKFLELNALVRDDE
jgi:acyl carrier protein